jgi:NAD(P)-dependent dehydrogenase (short-subunit alcohol dehydrogenase family)
MRPAGKVTIVTGASLGLEHVAAARFARGGASVVVADVNEADVSAQVAELKSEGLEAKFVRTDVSKECSVEAQFDATF